MNLPIRNSRIKLSQGQIFWHEVGQGTPIVFLHDAWSDSSQWLPVIQQLSPKYHCVAPDLLGCGESERPDKLTYSVELQVESLSELFEVVRLRQAYLVGVGMGGWIAATYALRHPDFVKGLVLLAPEGVRSPLDRNRWTLARWLTGNPPIALWLLQAIAPLAKVLGWKRVPELLQLRKQWRRSPAACQILFKRRKAALQAERLDEHLGWLKVPLLLLQAEHAEPIAAALTQAYTQAPHAELRLLSGAHTLPDTAPDAVSREIHRFIQEL